MGEYSAQRIQMIKNHILIKNIYYMLSYAFTSLTRKEYESLASEEFDNIHNLFAAILAKGIGRQLKQGLYREYQSRTAELSALRGKVDIKGSMNNLIMRKRRLSCEFDELSENNIYNQILKTTAYLLIKQPDVARKYKDTLKKEMLLFSDVDTLDLKSVKWNSLRFHRNLISYRMLISICQLITQGMLLSEGQGSYKMASFIDDREMSHLYEKFILEYYRKEHPDIKASASYIPWALDDGVGTLLPAMHSDITLRSKNHVLIIDAKYYSHTMQGWFGSESIHSGNLYQIFTYVKNTQTCNPDKTVSGMLLYARTDETLQPDNSYQMSGNRISVKTLDLNRDFKEIAKQLDCIAEEYLGGVYE